MVFLLTCLSFSDVCRYLISSILCMAWPFSGSYTHGKKNVINKFRGASADSEKFHTNMKQNLTPVTGKVYIAPDFSSFLVPLVRCQKRR